MLMITKFGLATGAAGFCDVASAPFAVRQQINTKRIEAAPSHPALHCGNNRRQSRKTSNILFLMGNCDRIFALALYCPYLFLQRLAGASSIMSFALGRGLW